MCVKIIKNNESIPYDESKPLEEQAFGSEKIIVSYKQNDPAIEKFVDEVERICQSGVNCSLNIDVVANNILKGAKVKRKTKELEFQLKLNDLIKLMTLAQSEADKKLEDLANYCMDGNCRVKQKA